MKTISRYIIESVSSIVELDGWPQFRNILNKQWGMENTVLYKTFYETLGKTFNGKTFIDIDDPRKNDFNNRYIGYKVNGKFVGLANFYLEKDEIAIGDWEISKEEHHKGYGKEFFEAFLQYIKKYNRNKITLVYLDDAAKAYWEKMGFKVDHAKCMEYNID